MRKSDLGKLHQIGVLSLEKIAGIASRFGKPEDREHAYVQCVDSGEPYTDGGTVIFKCRRIEKEKVSS